MFIGGCLKWPEMRAVAIELIERMHMGHRAGSFQIPAVDFVRIFAPNANAAGMDKVAQRGDIHFIAEAEKSGSFRLATGERALFDLEREGLVVKLPARPLSGKYSLLADGFRIRFARGEELEGCRRLLLLICHRVVGVEVTRARVCVEMPTRLFDLCVEFD